MASAALARRRAQEAAFASNLTYIAAHKRNSHVATWEKNTTKRFEEQCALNGAKTLEEAIKIEQERRRNQMESLYDREMEEWNQIITASEALSIDERMGAIRKRVYQLRDIREAERKEYVKACLERQWRASCDDVRQAESRQLLDNVLKDRARHSNFAKEGVMAKDEARRVEEMKLRQEVMEKRAFADQRKIKEKNLETKQDLDNQVSMQRAKEYSLQQQRRREECEQIDKWKAEADAARKNEAERFETNGARGLDILRANERRLKDRELHQSIERREDELLLKYALAKEQKRHSEESATKEHGKGTATKDKALLHEQMKKDKVDSGRIDAIREAKMEEIGMKRDAELRARAQVREVLMAEVDEGRQAQIKEKEMLEQMRRSEIALEDFQCKMEANRLDSVDKEAQLRSKELTIQNAKTNMAIAELKSRKAEQKLQASLLERKRMEWEDKKRDQRLTNALHSMKLE
jgi:hypothetical protein